MTKRPGPNTTICLQFDTIYCTCATARSNIKYFVLVFVFKKVEKTHLKLLQFLGQNLHNFYMEALVISHILDGGTLENLFSLTFAVFLSGPFDKNLEIRKYNSANENQRKFIPI